MWSRISFSGAHKYLLLLSGTWFRQRITCRELRRVSERMFRRLLILGLLFLSVSPLWADKQKIRLGVLAFRGVEQTLRLWNPTARYLSEVLPDYQIEIIPLTHPEMIKALKEETLHYVLTNTGHYVEIEALFHVTRITTLVTKREGHALTQFGAVIFTRAGRKDIQSIIDLKNKTFMAVKRHAFGGFRMTWDELLNNGVDPFSDFRKLLFSGFPVDKVAYAVRDGKVDAGTFRTGVLERLHRAGKINIRDFKIVGAKKHPGFPQLVSTHLYPEWPFAKTRIAPSELTAKIVIALLQLKHTDAAAVAANIHGWTVPLDYQAVHELYMRLKVGPYKDLGKITFSDLIEQYQTLIIVIILVIVLLAIFLVRLLNLDRKVRRSEYRLAKAQEIAHIGNWEWDVERNIMTWSEEVFHIFGVDKKPEFIDIEWFLQWVYVEDREFVKETINDALYHEKPFNIDHRITMADGSVRMVHEQAEMHRTDTGKVVLVSGIVQDITKRKSAEDRVKESEQELASILNNMQDTFFRVNSAGKITSISPSVQQLLGYSMKEIVGTRFTRYLANNRDRHVFVAELRSNMGRVDNFEVLLIDKNNLQLSAAISAHFFYDADGDLMGLEGVARNISELVHARDDLTREKERIQTTLESIGDGVITTDITGIVEYMNEAAETITGSSLFEARGLPLFQIFNITTSRIGEPVEKTFYSIIKQEKPHAVVIHDAVLKNKEENRYFLEVTMAPIRDHQGKTGGTVIVFHDVTEIREMAKKMAYEAKHDLLTGLYNRREFESRLENLLQSYDGKTENAVVYVDFHEFQIVIDKFGHLAGDALLKQLSEQFRARVRETDTLARLGGESFGLLLEKCPLSQAKTIVESILVSAAELKFKWGDEIFSANLSIGLIVLDSPSLTVMDILQAADVACHKAWESGKNMLHVYEHTEELAEKRGVEFQWLSEMQAAMKQGRMVLYQQELVALNENYSNEQHFEMLVRMRNEKGDLVLPNSFIPAAERYNHIEDIDRWVFDKSIELLSQRDLKSCCICTINLSGHSIASETFRSHVLKILKSSGVPPQQLCFEISEASAISHYADTIQFITALHETGCRFTLDDFGNGTSSFGYLKSLPVDCVKIDGNLVRNIVDNPVDYSIVHSINEIAHAMGIRTVAKCVENEEIKKKLIDIGIDFGQGYGLKRPAPLSGDDYLSESA